jgi:translation initiation factor 2 beta subunit (eIF-2beta)/eIF-5
VNYLTEEISSEVIDNYKDTLDKANKLKYDLTPYIDFLERQREEIELLNKDKKNKDNECLYHNTIFIDMILGFYYISSA